MLCCYNLGGDVNATTADGVTPLMTASQAGCTSSVELLIARGTLEAAEIEQEVHDQYASPARNYHHSEPNC